MNIEQVIHYLLEEAKTEYGMMLQEVKSRNYQSAAEYSTRFNKVVEMIEVLDCGSVGGFGVNQPYTKAMPARYLWLKTKYEEKI